MARIKLTDRKIQSLQPAGKPYDVMDTAVPQLGVRVMGTTAAPVRSFVLIARFAAGKSPTRRALGSYARPAAATRELPVDELLALQHLTLSEAHAKAREWLRLISRGVDPAEHMKERARAAEKQRQAEAERRENTVDKVVDAFAAERLSRQRKGAVVERNLRRVFLSAWQGRAITDIGELDVLRIINAHKVEAPEYTRNLLNDCRQLFRYAIGARVYGIDANPCANLRPSELIGKKRKRRRVLSDDELVAFARAVRRLPYPYRQVYELLILTGQRLSVVAEASWSEFPRAVVRVLRDRRPGTAIDWSRISNEPLTWVVPAARMKGEDGEVDDFAIPLSPEVLGILETLPHFEGGDFLFSLTHGRRPSTIGSKVKSVIDARMLRTLRALARRSGDDPARVTLPGWVNHDLRRSARTRWARLPLAEETREAMLGHVQEGIKGVYNVHTYDDEKAELLALWAAKLRTVLEPRRAANVIALQARA